MALNLKDVLQAIGPNSALIFAAWIFMDFLQQRYIAAIDRYRSLISQYREGGLSDNRIKNIRDQIMLYKTRCELMKLATNLGLIAAILLIGALIMGAISAIIPDLAAMKYICTVCAFLGLALIIIAALVAIRENSIIQRATDSKLLDIPELAYQTNQKPGNMMEAR